MTPCDEPGELINLFALVAYLPPPLGPYLDSLRRELVPACGYASHVTVLPPRALPQDAETALAQVRRQLAGFPVFSLQLGEVEVFPVSSVIHLGIGDGRDHLIDLHERMNRDALAFDEPFSFHPHITLAQDFPLSTLASVRETARQRWAEFRHPRHFPVERFTFVQRTANNVWLNLADCPLRGADPGGPPGPPTDQPSPISPNARRT